MSGCIIRVCFALNGVLRFTRLYRSIYQLLLVICTIKIYLSAGRKNALLKA